ncbi:MAG: ATP-binding protein [Nitrospirae bacterium]|nr:ATP-binding protein [Nitrospirota bacterium]
MLHIYATKIGNSLILYKEVIKLCSLDFIGQKGNVIFLGPPGIGKTHLSISRLHLF